MATMLPKSAVLNSVYTGHYAYYMTKDTAQRSYVNAQEENVFSPYAKIEVEKAKISNQFVHLRFTFSNTYWARHGPSSAQSDQWIVASSKQPEEDTSKWSCTLFEPIIDNNEGVLYLRHVQSGKRVRAHTDTENSLLYVDDKDEGEEINWYAFTFVDWDTLVIMPENVAFKGDNGKFLKSKIIEGHEYLEFSSEDGNEEAAAFEVTMTSDGQLRLKSIYFGKFWRRSPNWIWADSTDTVGKDIDTLFWPIKVNDDTVSLRNAGNNRFCKRLTTEGKTSCLNAAASTITTETKMKVEELVLERDIYEVKYHIDDARIYDESVFVAGTGAATNSSDKTAKLNVMVSYQDVTSYSFQYSLSIMTGVKTSITTGFAKIAEGKIEVTAEVTNTLEWNTTTTETKTAQASYEAEVPPMSTVRVNYVAKRGKCDVPFSYTQRDKRSTDGRFVTSQHVDGIYTGVNYYNFRFEQVSIESL